MSRFGALVAAGSALGGCQVIAGLSERSVAGAGTNCLRNSDCSADLVCIFQVCAEARDGEVEELPPGRSAGGTLGAPTTLAIDEAYVYWGTADGRLYRLAR